MEMRWDNEEDIRIGGGCDNMVKRKGDAVCKMWLGCAGGGCARAEEW